MEGYFDYIENFKAFREARKKADRLPGSKKTSRAADSRDFLDEGFSTPPESTDPRGLGESQDRPVFSPPPRGPPQSRHFQDIGAPGTYYMPMPGGGPPSRPPSNPMSTVGVPGSLISNQVSSRAAPVSTGAGALWPATVPGTNFMPIWTLPQTVVAPYAAGNRSYFGYSGFPPGHPGDPRNGSEGWRPPGPSYFGENFGRHGMFGESGYPGFNNFDNWTRNEFPPSGAGSYFQRPGEQMPKFGRPSEPSYFGQAPTFEPKPSVPMFQPHTDRSTRSEHFTEGVSTPRVECNRRRRIREDPGTR